MDYAFKPAIVRLSRKIDGPSEPRLGSVVREEAKMAFGKMSVAAALAAALVGFGAPPALALVPIPIGVPDGAATDLLTVNGTYTSLQTPLAQPFAASTFTLSLVVPAQVTVSAAGPVFSEFSIPVTGSYANDGQTETFSTAFAVFGATNTGLSTFADNFSLVVSGLLQPADSFTLSFQAGAPLFNPTTFTAGAPETIATGDLTIADASAGYGPDPAFTGTVDITPQSATVPEPATWAMILAGFAALGSALRATRRNPALGRA